MAFSSGKKGNGNPWGEIGSCRKSDMGAGNGSCHKTSGSASEWRSLFEDKEGPLEFNLLEDGGGGGGGVGGPSSSRNPRYKTEMCRNFKERSRCIYGDQCQFAHGRNDLRDVVRNTKYKTKLCQKYWVVGYCAYGPRCNFLHDESLARQLAANGELGKAKSTGSISPTPSLTPSMSDSLANEELAVGTCCSSDDVFTSSQWPKVSSHHHHRDHRGHP